MAITLYSDKGSELTIGEMDTNFDELNKIPTGKIYPKTKGEGIKIDYDNPDWGWHDLLGQVTINSNNVNSALFATYIGGLEQIQCAENKEMTWAFHMPHDWAVGTDLYIHVHWSHISSTLTGGDVTWGFETVEAQGYDQEAFDTIKTISINQNASVIQRQHMIAEGLLSISGGSATQLNTDHIDVDSLILCRLYLDSNNLTDSVSPPDPFVHMVDIHYQSTGLPTKNRNTDFWV